MKFYRYWYLREKCGSRVIWQQENTQVFRIFKLARVLKLARHSPGLQVMPGPQMFHLIYLLFITWDLVIAGHCLHFAVELQRAWSPHFPRQHQWVHLRQVKLPFSTNHTWIIFVYSASASSLRSKKTRGSPRSPPPSTGWSSPWPLLATEISPPSPVSGSWLAQCAQSLGWDQFLSRTIFPHILICFTSIPITSNHHLLWKMMISIHFASRSSSFPCPFQSLLETLKLSTRWLFWESWECIKATFEDLT